MYTSETVIVRHFVLPYCVGKGCDIGAAGDKIVKTNCDYIGDPAGYACCGNDPIDVPCRIDENNPVGSIPVPDQTYDYVYSSHLIEDFFPTGPILREHVRLVKSGGNLILAFPDQQRYLAWCRKNGTEPNQAHRADTSLAYMLAQLALLDDIKAEILFTSDCQVTYNVIIVARITR